MKRKTVFKILVSFLVVAGSSFFVTGIVYAQVDTSIGENLILGNTSPVDLIVSIVNWTLGLLALVATGIILWGGFAWMLSGGNEEKVANAKLILRNGVIGLVIVLASWGIATFVINLLLDFTNAQDPVVITSPSPDPNYPDGSPFYVDHTNPRNEEENVPLCHIVATTYSFPLNEPSVTSDSFKVTIPRDAVSNPDGGKSNGDVCTEGKECLSGDCSANSCVGGQLAGSIDFSESSYSAVFYPAADYYEDTKYKVILTTAIKGVDPDNGAVYNLESSDPKRIYTFTTGTETDDVPPTVNVVSVTPYPSDGDDQICLNPTLQASFSESLDPASPDDQNVWLYEYGDFDGDGVDDDPSDSLDVDYIRMTSIGGETDDTIVTGPEEPLSEFTEYGMNLYSGDAATDTFEGAIFDTCGNPLSGDFDLDMEGHPIDDFVDPASSGLDQAFCSCLSGVESCNVAVGAIDCDLGDATCTLDATCNSSHENYVGFDYQWTWTTGDEPYCVPEIDSIAQEDNYYSEDEEVVGETGSSDTGKVLITGSYLYPFYEVDFYNNISAASQNCFDTDHVPTMSCFVSNVGANIITLRTPVASQTGQIRVENNDGSDTSLDQATIDSPYIRTTSPASGPAGQYVTIKGKNFLDYDPNDEFSSRGQVFFNDVEAEVMCDDGWDNTSIIVRVPDDFEVDERTLIQVITTEERYSNQRGFTIDDGEPGPGLCLLEPSCSDTGDDDVIAIGENFGDERGAIYFKASNGVFEPTASIQYWNEYNATYDSQSVATNGTPVSELDDYDFSVANINGISNGLDFDISCSNPPRMFRSYQCSPSENLIYLPNPPNGFDNVCVNSTLAIAFTNDMDNDTIRRNGPGGVDFYRCNYGYDGDTKLPFDDSECVHPGYAGGHEIEFLSDAYLGGDGSGVLDGSEDVDGDGDLDAYEVIYFPFPDGLEAGYHYKVVLDSSIIKNTDGVNLLEDEIIKFQVRNDEENCVADYINMTPSDDRATSYDDTNRCTENIEVDNDGDGIIDDTYSYRVRQYTENCMLLADAGTYNWTIGPDVPDRDIIQFGDLDNPEDSPSEGDTDTTTTGFNNVCLQGEDADNAGEAFVEVTLVDPNDGSDAASDGGVFDVDFGYCTNDSDCYTNECQDTYCDLVTHHCAPDIISFSPNNASGPDVGPTGCITLNGCYFGSDQEGEAACTCESLKKEGYSCDVSENGNVCLLDNGSTTCSLGEEVCTLDDACSALSPTANFYDGGGLKDCTCTADGNGNDCNVKEGNTTCVATGDDLCIDSYPTYQEPNSGSVLFNTSVADYPSEVFCDDTWDSDQVIAQVPTSLAANLYGITLKSRYYNDIDGEYLYDIYSASEGDEDCEVGSDATPCLCQVDPASGEEDDTVNLYGENFTLLTDDGGEKVTFKSSTSRVDSIEGTWADDNTVEDTEVPQGAVADGNEGVQLESDTLASNALGFSVSCSANLDCSTGCCNDFECVAAEVCNECLDDTDCSYGECNSVCVDGMCSPYVIDLSPGRGAVGQPTTVQGCHFGTYYSSGDGYDPYSMVTADGIEAPLACSESDSWNNNQIIVTMPDGIFADASTQTAEIVVRQVYNGGADTQNSNDPIYVDDADGDGRADGDDEFPYDVDNDGQDDNVDPDFRSVFSKDNSCSEVDIPVLCDADPAYSPYTATYDITLSGENFLGESDGYCTCNTDSLGECEIDEGDDSCSLIETTSYYVNPNDQAEVCTTLTSNATTIYDAVAGYCVHTSNPTTVYVNPADETEVCDATTSNAYTTYDAGLVACIYEDPDDATKTCSIDVGDTFCSICTIAVDDTDCELVITEDCEIDEDGDAIADTCGASISSFVEQSGVVDYTDEIEASIDWAQYTNEQYLTDVPDDSETGDVKAIARTSGGRQCVGNGLEFPVTCSSCSDCASEDNNLNCNLDYEDLPAGVGSCTPDTTGFCRAEPDSCCNNTSCVYDDSTIPADDDYDTGSCASQPLILLDYYDTGWVNPSNHSRTCTVATSNEYTVYDSESGYCVYTDPDYPQLTCNIIVDDTSCELFLDGGKTNPQPNAENICPNGELKVNFNTKVTTSDVFEDLYNESDTPIPGVEITSEDLEYYVSLIDLNTGSNVTLDEIELNSGLNIITLKQEELLNFENDYSIVIRADDSVVSGTDHQLGIVSYNDGVAVGCDSDHEAAGMCDTDGYLEIPFTTLAEADFEDVCGPGLVDLDATRDGFVDADYTFTKSEQKETFGATVYSAGVDRDITTEDDNQPITRIEGSEDQTSFYWNYTWDEKYDSIQDLENASCPIAGIITGGNLGSCSCAYENTCTMNENDPSCEVDDIDCETDSENGVCDATDSNWDADTSTCSCTAPRGCLMNAGDNSCNIEGIACFTDSPSEVCDVLDSTFDSDTNRCNCFFAGSCKVDPEETSCEIDFNEDESSVCSLDATCNDENEYWSVPGFTEDKQTQKVTADSEEGITAVEVMITGDGSVEQGWSGLFDDDQDVAVYFCAEEDYFESFSNEDYHMYWAYCRGESPQESSFLPKFTTVFERDSVAIDLAYGSPQDFIYEVALKDELALSYDPDANNNTIAIRVYENDLDNDFTTMKDMVGPDLWFQLIGSSTGSGGGSETKVDDYRAIRVGNTMYIAATNLDEDAGTLKPYIIVMTFSSEAETDTEAIVNLFLDHFEFNYGNTGLSNNCQEEKLKIVRDTERVSDLGTVAYLLSSYYHNDADGDGSLNFPTINSGTYIAGLTTSIWSSWTSVLGNALGQTLPTDPINEYADAEVNCPYNAPDLNAGDDPSSPEWTYYDENGTCWDPILKDYYGPPGSYLYTYLYNESTDPDEFELYSNLEYDGTGSWQESAYDPCRLYSDKSTPVTDHISDFSDEGCDTFNYVVTASDTTLDGDYDDNFE
ncbi:MAG: hypothetical protein Q8P90_00450 [bacterium]|nr:hypothetical protein [bacterium]